MLTSRSPDPAELLLQLLELASVGPARAEQMAAQLRRRYRFAGLASRIGRGLHTLETEGMIESGSDGEQVLYCATPSGLATLAQRGRFTGISAVLFTDMVGSTELIGSFGETGAHALRQRHFSLLRAAVTDHSGLEVKSLGDGLMVVFADPVAAIACATAMQRSVAGDHDRLGLRIGVHAGELLREGNDFFGTTVIIARRLCESAQAGEIVVSHRACALAGADAERRVQSLGPISLKGLGNSVAASVLLWSDEPRTRSRPNGRRAVAAEAS